MDNLYFEKKVATAADVKHCFEEAVKKNAKYYRGVSGSNKYFGWVGGKHVQIEQGKEWFENPEYKEPILEAPILEEASSLETAPIEPIIAIKPVEIKASEIKPAEIKASEIKPTEKIPPVVSAPAIDWEQLYNDLHAKHLALIEKYSELEKSNAENQKIVDAIKLIKGL